MRKSLILFLSLCAALTLGACESKSGDDKGAAKTEEEKATPEPQQQAPTGESPTTGGDAPGEGAAGTEPAETAPAGEGGGGAAAAMMGLKKADMPNLKITAEGWEGEYNEMLDTWTFEKYTPNDEGFNDANRMYVDEFPSDAPADAAAYAKKLVEDENFQDMGSKFAPEPTITELPAGGWIIEGMIIDTMGIDPEAGPQPGFSARIDIDGAAILCHSGTMTSEALKQEAIEACKAATF